MDICRNRQTHFYSHRMAYAEADSGELPEGWVWASAQELREIYAVPNAFADFQGKVEVRLH